jgi:AraC-like DNA-binding protein
MAAPPIITLPGDVPTCTSHYGIFHWSQGWPPTMLLNVDFDLFWVTRGAATLKIGPRLTLRAGRDELMILPPFVPGLIDAVATPMSFHFFHFGFRNPLRGPLAASPTCDVHVPMRFALANVPRIAPALRAVGRIDRTKPRADWRLEQLTIDIVSELARFGERRGRKPGDTEFQAPEPGDPRVADICQRIQLDPAQPWSVVALAESVGLSPSRLHALCRQCLGRSLKAHIVRTRLHRSLQRLRDRSHGHPSIKEVSIACGFSSQHFFSRQFKGMFRQTPAEYRDGAAL